MTRRTVTDEGYCFLVSDDPRNIIGHVLGMLVSNLDRAELDVVLAPDGDGYGVDTVGAVVRVDLRADLPEPWDQDPTLDPEATELWALSREEHQRTMWTVIPGDELRDLVAQAHAFHHHKRSV